jgi:hypothetical protein
MHSARRARSISIAPHRGAYIKVDVKFDGSETVERGIDVEDLETFRHPTAPFAG